MNRNANTGARPKKTGKEKRKSQLEQQPQTAASTSAAAAATEKSNSSPTKEVCYTRQYAGLSGDSIALYAEQTSEERLSEDVCDRLAEDINYKLRQIIHTSMVRARLTGRSALHATDVDETFHSLNLDKVYGAPANPEFIPFGDEGLYYLNDTKINLIEISEQEIAYLQPGDARIERKWIRPEEEESEVAREQCFTTICEMLVGSDHEEQLAALYFVESECGIGSIIDWFYNFAYFLLSQYFSCEPLIVCALSLVESLEGNPVTDLAVSQRQLNVVARVLLQKIFMVHEKSSLLRYTCTTLALLCQRNDLRTVIFEILNEKAVQIKNNHLLAFAILISSMGIDAVEEFFLPFTDDFFTKSQENCDLKFELLGIFNVIFKERLEDEGLYKKYFETFPNTMQMFSLPPQAEEVGGKTTSCDAFILSMLEQKCSVTMAVNLLKTRRKLPIFEGSAKKMDVNSVFGCVRGEPRIKIVGKSLKSENLREKSRRIYEERRSGFGDRKSYVLVGRTTLLASVFKNVQFGCKKSRCCDHSLRLVL